MEYIIIFIGLIPLAIALKLLLQKANYQFEKTTNGRVVKFLEYDESRRYKRLKMYGVILFLFGIMIILSGTIIFHNLG
jgi:hypothetical protein